MTEYFEKAAIRLMSYTFYEGRNEFFQCYSHFAGWVLIAPEAGQFVYEIGGETGQATFGDAVCAAPGVPLYRHVVSPSLRYHVLQWSFDQPQRSEELELWQQGKWTTGDVARLSADYALMRPLMGKRDGFSARRLVVLLEDVLHLLWEARQNPTVLDPLMREAARLLQEQAGRVFSMSSISGAVGLGPVQFTRRFRAAHGMTPIVFLTRLRLEIAQKRLIETDATLDEIAAQCGWAHGYYLSNVFMQHMGMAPGRFRKLHRIG